MTYQEKIKQYRLPTYGPEAAVLGLLAEAGEVAAVFQKLIRGDFSEDVALTKLKAELGDLIWHIAAVASDNGWTMEDLENTNLEKLADRKLRSVILGSGDSR